MRRDWWLISDIDGTLTGDPDALAELKARLERDSDRIGFGVASGRSPELTAAAVVEFGLPEPELLICSVGSEVRAPGVSTGKSAGQWPGELAADWRPQQIRSLLEHVTGLELQDAHGHGPYKLGYLAAGDAAHRAGQVLSDAGLETNLIHSADRFLDIMPAGVSKGAAVRFVAARLGHDLSRIVVAGDTGNDLDMLLCGALAIMVGNHSSELGHLKGEPLVHAAKAPHAGGVIEGMVHHGVWDR